ncbi:TIGR01244 family sulfur transferase [Amaricoccus macauensis]|uniref:TIGR01244 family sulfur transferase n=1 Tax=Amaricoccus macauensis TaxID=57001 RepID=UPI003C7B6839
MNITEITPSYSVSPQITVGDVATIAEKGFNSIMCNRPNGEDPGQTDVEEIRAEAERLGLTFAFVPVVSGSITPENVIEFKDELAKLPTPVFAYCRSGGRCQNLWLLAGNAR